MSRSGRSLAANSGDREQVRSRTTPNAKGARPLEWAGAGVFLAILTLYLGLIPLGQWQADEYDYFGRLKTGAWQAFIERLNWSPRPIGEMLYLGYGLLANQFRRPLTGWFLGLLWAGFLLCAALTALTTTDRARRLPTLMIGLMLAAACLTSGALSQVFYWPAGAVAYLTTLSATLLVSLQVLDGRLSYRTGQTICCLALLVAALSSEMGAIFTACFALFYAAKTVKRWTRASSDHMQTSWWLLPGAASLLVLLWVVTHRLPVSETEFALQSPALHNPLQSAASAATKLVLEIAGWSSGMKHPASAVVNVMARLCLAAGVAVLWRSSRTQPTSKELSPSRTLLPFVAVLLAACFLSLFASYLHFGDAGGQRYETLRRGWILMAYVALTVSFGAALPRRRRKGLELTPILLLAGVLLPWHVSPLVRQYSRYGDVLDAVKQTFESGYAPGEEMIFVVPASGGVITPATLASGTYTGTSQTPGSDYARYILRYFGKERLVVLGAEPRKPLTVQPAP